MILLITYEFFFVPHTQTLLYPEARTEFLHEEFYNFF